MYIESVSERLPLVLDKTSLRKAFIEEALLMGIPMMEAAQAFERLPRPIQQAPCFLEAVSNLWRYEYGEPYQVNHQTLLGTHMWPCVKHVVAVACRAQRILSPQDFARYMIRLGDRKKHEEYLVEFLPALRFDATTVTADFEFKTGAGDRDVDWRFRRPGHVPVLVEVKHRIADFINLAERMQKGEQRPNGHAPEPQHDGTMLFRSVEKKFVRADPDVQLHGVWVHATLMQEAQTLAGAFSRLDPRKVHLTVLGGWEPGVHVLAHRRQDIDRVLAAFGETSTPDSFEFVSGSK